MLETNEKIEIIIEYKLEEPIRDFRSENYNN